MQNNVLQICYDVKKLPLVQFNILKGQLLTYAML